VYVCVCGQAFAVYIYVVGTAFVIYWEINSYCTARHEPQAEQASLDGGSVTRVHFQLGNGTAGDGVGSHSNPALTDHDTEEDVSSCFLTTHIAIYQLSCANMSML
jgi:hypothetical protein